MRIDAKKSFTLIELLVVIAVIAILMGILMPVLNRVRRHGKNIKCQANLRQWGMIFSIYLGDYDGGFFPMDCPHYMNYGYEDRNTERLFSPGNLVINYFEFDRRIMLCPMTPLSRERERGLISGIDYRGGTNTPWIYNHMSWNGSIKAAKQSFR